MCRRSAAPRRPSTSASAAPAPANQDNVGTSSRPVHSPASVSSTIENTSISRRESEDEGLPCAIPRRRSRLQGAPIPSPACPSSRQSRRPSSAPWRRAPHRRRGRTSHARPSGRSGSSAPSACQARRRDHPTCSCWQHRFASDHWAAYPITRIRRPRGYGWRDVGLTDRRDPCRCAPRTRRAIGGRAPCRCIL